MNYYLVIEDSNYADEFDLKAMKVIKSESEMKETKKNFLDRIEKERGKAVDEDDEEVDDLDPKYSPYYPIEAYFGTNESVEVADREDLESLFTFKKISEDEFKTLKKLLGESFGVGAFI